MYASPDLLNRAIRSGGYSQVIYAQARRGTQIAYDYDLPIVTGSIQDKTGDGVRRTLTVEIKSEPGLFDALAPTGTSLHIFNQVTTGGEQAFTIPMGVFDVDLEEQGLVPGATLNLTCPDKWARIQRARFIAPRQSNVGQPVTQQITELIREVLGANQPVLNYTRGLWTMPPLVWEKDRDKAINELAASVGVYVSFDRTGRCEIRDLPQLGDNAVWMVDASPTGVLAGGSRRSSRSATYNVVVVSGESAGEFGPGFQPVVVWDSDPASPTFAGPDPMNRPDLAGPFGIAPYFHSSSAITDRFQALQAANTILAKTVGLAKSMNLEAARHPCLDAYDPIDVMPPREEPTATRRVERHMVDAVTHALTPEGTQSITGRSTRTDAYT
jgi:hypothetical protein